MRNKQMRHSVHAVTGQWFHRPVIIYRVPEIVVFQSVDREDLVIIACTVFDWTTRVMDRQTDKQNCDG